MNQCQIFTSKEFGNIRVVEIDRKPYAVGVDVARALDYSNPSKAVIDHCKGISKLGIPSEGGMQNTNLIPEGDIYRLIIKAADQSRNPEIKTKAERFERWVFDDVLPSIQKHGAYATETTIDRILGDPDFGIQLLQKLKAEQTKNTAYAETINIQNQQIAEMRPKAGYYDVILAYKDAVSVTTIAKDYGKSGKWLNDYLHTLGVQYKQGDIWLLYQKHAENGYSCTRTHTYIDNNGEQRSRVHTYWTQKGRLFIYELLKSKGWFPLIERSNQMSLSENS